ncbi:MAG: methyltransferase [Aquificae bacterium]|nr:methyltransferase [Aquificota bacterium]
MVELKENSYVKSFKRLRIAKLFESREEFRSLRRKNTFWKEISEAMAVRERIKDHLIRDPSHVVIDVASGKGFLSTLVALMHPRTKVIALDLDEGAKRDHFSYLKNAQFVKMDIMKEEFIDFVRKAGEKVVLTGIHLCRELSERFIEAVNRCENVKLAVLVPCCEGKFPRERYQFIIEELGVYEGWCCYLQDRVGEGIRVRVKRDKKMLSPKNILIIMEREER